MSNQDNGYYGHIRKDLLSLLPKELRGAKTLEVGCANGGTLLYLRDEGIASEIVGSDIITPANAEKLDRVVVCDLNKTELEFEQNYFDLIICADVLEHLTDPWGHLAKISSFLKEDGVLLMSLPNIRYKNIIKELLLGGAFRYKESGIMDKTHLRFFCKSDMIALVEGAGLYVAESSSSFEHTKKHKRSKLFNKLTGGVFEEFFVQQYFFLLRKSL